MEENPSESENEAWRLSVDGSSCLTCSGAGVLLVSPSGWTLEYALRFGFKATNNEAEWEALIAGLTIAKHLEVRRIEVSSDSQLVVGLASGEYELREDSMVKLLIALPGFEAYFRSPQYYEDTQGGKRPGRPAIQTGHGGGAGQKPDRDDTLPGQANHLRIRYDGRGHTTGIELDDPFYILAEGRDPA
ncbi:RVT_3 domain-containing protein [Cephalotus follicularis]|uniref:RVT_3 domain-containing protein n=1 Tax=Cephalotus follicularis TaxID=3775 RepID=A0A1Q3CVA7_CEPFO|nr:RVT_3 domain-containing protein [Cephalotus follicularis]